MSQKALIVLIVFFVAIAAVALPAAANPQADSGKPLVRVAVKSGQSPLKLQGNLTQRDDGTLNLPAGDPWGWAAVGPGGGPMRELEGLRSLTICGWARPISLRNGPGGNRIACNLNYNRAGFDLVHYDNGRLRLAVNQWPDRAKNDSSAGKLAVGKWVFFAVTYDGTRRSDNVVWYFGDPKTPAVVDRTNSYAAGATDSGSGPLSIGNYNRTLHSHGMDRQFRGQLHAVQIFGSRTGTEGALSLKAVRQIQTAADAVPDFAAAVPEALTKTANAVASGAPSDAAIVGLKVPTPPPGTRPRIIATTDGEIDDRCSMVRFLMYANEWDIEGIIHCSSKFHWKGDGKNIRAHGWADEVWLDNQIDLYEKVYPRLSKHAEGFPTADALRKLVYTGNVANVGDMSRDTPGSDRIVEVLLDNEPGPVYLQAWGGTNTIARALWKIQHEHADAMDRVSKKAVIFIILDQDKTFRDYIQPNWPKLQVLGSFRQFAAIAYNWGRIIPQPEKSFYEKAWMERNILKDHGPLCAVYEHAGGAFRSEGDSPSFMHQIDVGLRSLEHPGFGGWGGRFRQERSGSHTWRGARDGGNVDRPIWRWSEAFQNDWAARADWCVKGPDAANHPPAAKVAGPLDWVVSPSQKVMLSAEGSTDPDGDRLTYRWWQYTDVDSADAEIEIANADAKSGAAFVVPDEPGETIHVILEVTDDGQPSLTRYQRIVFTIARKTE